MLSARADAHGVPLHRTTCLTVTAAALLVGAIAALGRADLGPLAHHMSLHLLLMNVAAPLVAVGVVLAGWLRRPVSGTSLFAATLAQLALLWAAHAPAAVAAASRDPAIANAGMVLLFAVALWFWCAVLAEAGAAGWRAIVALLVTGKLFCLLAAILVFAPRQLYAQAAHAGHSGGLDDQHLAGLLMITACPLSYVAAAIVIAARWIADASGQVSGAAANRPRL